MSYHETEINNNWHISTRNIPIIGDRFITSSTQDLGVIKKISEQQLPNGDTNWSITLEDGRTINFNMTLDDREAAQRKLEMKRNKEEALVKTAYYNELLAIQTPKDYFPNSTNPPNPDLLKDESIYNQYLKPYLQTDLSNNTINPDKVDYPEKITHNFGHKLHLNIEAKDVVVVSKYLKDNGYRHKYLSGGEIEDGKVFTVYIGSKDLTDELAQKISSDLQTYLRRPVFVDEVEYAPNVVGRFESSKGTGAEPFSKYGFGIRGVDILRQDKEKIVEANMQKFNNTRSENEALLPGGYIGAFTRSFERLSQDYGSFFYGTKTKK